MKYIICLILFDLCIPNEKSVMAQSLIFNDSAAVEMTQGWTYRWGDSPLDRYGVPAWISDSALAWHSITLPDRPTDREGQNNLWMRLTLPAVDNNDPCLYINSVANIFEVYLEKQLIYKFGEISASGQGKFAGYKIHFIPLPPAFQGKNLFFRIYSNRSNKIGIESRVWLGSRYELVLTVIRTNLDIFMLGCFITFIGLFSVFIFFKERVQITYLSFGASAICSGIFVIIRNKIIDLFFEGDVVWKYNIEIISLFLTPTVLGIFIEQNFKKDLSIIVRRTWQVFSIYTGGAISLWAFNITPLTSAVRPFQLILMAGIAVIITVIITAAWKGNRMAKMFNLGVVLLSLFGIHDILINMGIIPDWHNIFPWGLLIFIIFIGYILERRFALTAVKREQERSKLLEAEFRVQAAELQAKLADAQSLTIRSERMASLGRLTAGIAHEIKNPLNFVNNFAEVSLDLLRELKEVIENLGANGDDRRTQSINMISELEQNQSKINEHGKRADTIIKSMLLHARGGKGQKVMSDINALLDEYLKLSYHGFRAKDPAFNITLTTQFDANLPHLEVIPENLGRVFMNIIANGFYSAFEKKKELEQNALKENSEAASFSPEINVSTRNLDEKIEIRIRDNGKGVSALLKDKIFSPFFTTKPAGQGTGLGLSISYDIVVGEHGGELKVESREGEFAEFIITLPKS